eukprot:Opistho-2@12080
MALEDLSNSFSAAAAQHQAGENKTTRFVVGSIDKLGVTLVSEALHTVHVPRWIIPSWAQKGCIIDIEISRDSFAEDVLRRGVVKLQDEILELATQSEMDQQSDAAFTAST